LYNGSLSYVFAKDTTYTQSIYDISEGTWNNQDYKAYAKSDGFVLVTDYNNPDNFVSEYVSELDNIKVNGILKTQALYIQNSILANYDIFFLSTDSGFYAVSSGSNSDVFGNEFVARKVLDNPSGVTKFNKSFIPNQIPSVPVNVNVSNYLFILTDDGLLRTTNWKWANPASTSNIVVSQRFLQGLECFSYHISTSESVDGVKPGKSKIFIGTNKGVYRSLDEGNSFHKTEFMGANPSSVYDLKVFSSSFNSLSQNVLLAATNNGLWYTLDDGDNWYRTGENTTEGYSPVLFQSKPIGQIKFVENDSNSTGYLAQTFTTASIANTISKVSAYIKIREQDNISSASYNNSVSNSSLIAYVYSVDVNNRPQTQLAASSSVTSSNIRRDGFTTFDLTSDLDIPGSGTTTLALVIRETSSSIPLFYWRKSSQSNPVAGSAFTSINCSTWYEQTNQYFISTECQ
jgi:hypothetical protein